MEQEPTGARRRLGAELRRLRVNAGLKLEDAARGLGCSTSKISRLENGKGVPRPAEVTALVAVYGGASGAEAEMLDRLVAESRTRGWWEPFTEGLRSDPHFLPAPGRYAAVETDATAVAAFDLTVLHGLLQTADYARAALRARLPDRPDREIDQLVDLRRRRREALTATPPLALDAVVDESVLARATGGAGVMAAQLDRLLDLAGSPGVTLRVLSFAAGPLRAHAGRFAILTVPPELGPDVVHTEGHAGETFLESGPDVATYRAVFDEVRAAALDRDGSLDAVVRYRDAHRAAVTGGSHERHARTTS
ncbi:helix-turn-helix domain-containing protein [Pseudonocardia spirodelae]|uniref:Helix-turn-helix transcriptional regulator n=1 Tax=Pseudonocardia spirodelae TaxID=3133431 RepID=A0ABU8T4N0_9PSEU